MANTYNEHNGTGSQDTFAYTFPYLKTTDVKVSVDGVVKQLTTDYTRPSVTTIQFNSDKKPANGAKVRIYRDTNESSANATFYAGSAIKSQDLNDNFLQAIYIGEEGKEAGDDSWNKLEDSVDSTETWVSNNTTISTTGAIDARVDSKIDTALTTDVAAGNKITVTDNSPGSGQITVALTSGSLVNSDVNASAAIAGTKISPDFGSQHIATTGTVDGRDVSADGTKLDGIETNATADQTNAEIRAAVEAASDSNVFTDADHTKLNAIEASATADQTVSEIKSLIAGSPLDASHLAANSVGDSEIATGALDNRYYTETESDARYFNISTGDTIKDGDTFPDNDTTIASTAAINDRIIDLVDDVGGFVPIANETSFPNANPDVNDGAGTIVSIKALGSNVTSNGSGVATIANGTVGNSTVTINGLANSTTYAAGIGILVETTSTLNTYTFHRQVPNATEVTTVASKATEIGRLGTTAAVEDLSILGTTAVVADLAILGTTDVVSDMNTLATSDVVADMNTLAVTSVINDMDTCATNVSNINTVGGAITNVNTVATNLSSVNDFAARYRVASSAPSSSLDTGDLYFDTSANELKVYNGSAWQGGVTATGNLAGLGANQFTGNQSLGDNLKVQLGAGNDLQLYHDGGNSYLHNSTGNLIIKDTTDTVYVQAPSIRFQDDTTNEDIAKFISDGAVELYYDNSKKFYTHSGGAYCSGNLGASDELYLPDNGKLVCGTGDDLQIYHTGTKSYIKDSGTGSLRINSDDFRIYNAADDEYMLKAAENGAVELYYDNVKKLTTYSTGVEIHGSEGANCELYLYADEGDDDADNWKLTTLAASSTFKLQNRASGSWETNILATGNGAVDLYYDNVKKFETTTKGIGVIDNDSTVEIALTDSGGAAGHIYGKQSDGLISILVGNGEHAVNAYQNGAVKLYYDNSKKFETTSGGAQIEGNLVLNGYIDMGAGSIYTDDNGKVRLGTGSDLQIYHDGSNSYIDNTAGELWFRNNQTMYFYNDWDNEYYAKFLANGSVELYYDGVKKLQTSSGGVGFYGNLWTDDNNKIYLGTGNDLQIYHDGTNSYIKNLTNDFFIQNATSDWIYLQPKAGENSVVAKANGSVDLYFDNSKKFETTADGIFTQGTILHKGAEGGTAQIRIEADEGDDLTDRWRLVAQTDGTFDLQNLASGTYETNISATGNGTVELYHNNSKKLETTSTGIDVTGAITVNGAALGGGLSVADDWVHSQQSFSSGTHYLGGGNWTKMVSASSSVTTVTSDTPGIFTMPSTGVYRVEFCGRHGSGTPRFKVEKTANNGTSWDNLIYSDPLNDGNHNHFVAYFNCTNTSNDKLRFGIYRQSGSGTMESIRAFFQKLN